jgi:glucose-1-phosphate adenylyltransferase
VDIALAMILAGGRGKRMDVFCQHRAKPALPFASTARVIDFTLSNCVHSMIGNIAVLTDYHRIGMASYLHSWVSSNGNPGILHLLEPRNGSYLGTADAVYQNIDFLKKDASDLVLVLAGDHVYKMDYRKMIAYHRQAAADATVAVVPVPIEQAHRFGIVKINDKFRITGFVEKPEVPQSNLVSMGIYVFDKQVLIKRLTEDAALPNSPHDFGHAVMPRMIRRDKVAAYKFNGYWRDIGTPQAYYEANMEILPQAPLFNLNGPWSVLTESNCLAPPRISPQGSVRNSLVSPRCVIRGHVENSVISPGVWVAEEAIVRDSVIMADTFIGNHSVVDHCILSEGVNVGRWCYLGFGGTIITGEWEATVLGDGVTVPPHTVIGRNCKILPHIGPGDFAGRVVPSNSVLSPIQGIELLPIGEKEVCANFGQGIRIT